MKIQRQLTDIISRREQFKDTSYITEASVAEFNDFAQELKMFLVNNSKNELVVERANRIEPVQYEEAVMPWWSFIISLILFPGLAYYYYREYQKKAYCRDKILEITDLFASIEFLVRSES